MFSFKTFRSAGQSIIRNKWLTFATVTVMTLTLFTISIFLMLNILVSSTIDTVKSRINLEVYIKPGVTEDLILSVKKDVSKLPQVKDVQYLTPADALQKWQEKYKNNSTLYQAANQDNNPLPASLVISLYKVEDIAAINKLFIGGQYQAITDNTSYQKDGNGDIVNRLIVFSYYIREGGIALSLIFLITSLIVVLNTIRMTMYTRKEEIEIMKLVGATNWYIRWPFILEGAFYGFISMIIASIGLIVALKFGAPYLQKYLLDYSDNFFNSLNAYGLMILGWQFLISIFVGVVSSSIAIGRYLKI